VLDYAAYHWIVLYTVHFTAFCLGGRFFESQCNIDFSQRRQRRFYVAKFVQIGRKLAKS